MRNRSALMQCGKSLRRICSLDAVGGELVRVVRTRFCLADLVDGNLHGRSEFCGRTPEHLLDGSERLPLRATGLTNGMRFDLEGVRSDRLVSGAVKLVYGRF